MAHATDPHTTEHSKVTVGKEHLPREMRTHPGSWGLISIAILFILLSIIGFSFRGLL